jgi:pyruvate formate lyase activating enzyme
MRLGQEMTIEALVEHVKRDMVFYKHSGGGLTVSGGEPLLNSDFMIGFLQSVKEEGINTGIDTCGHVPWENIESVLPYIDFFLWDIKHMNPERHEELTGVTNEIILRNLAAVSERHIPIYIRVPLIPGYNDSDENMKLTAELARELPSVVEIDLIPLHHLGQARYRSLGRAYPIAGHPLISNDALSGIKRIVESYGVECLTPTS